MAEINAAVWSLQGQRWPAGTRRCASFGFHEPRPAQAWTDRCERPPSRRLLEAARVYPYEITARIHEAADLFGFHRKVLHARLRARQGAPTPPVSPRRTD